MPNVKFSPAAFSMPSLLPGRATGGSVTGGQPYLVGERGPELFMPGRSGGIAPSGSFGGIGNVVVNVDATGSSAQGDSAQANKLGEAIGLAVRQELIKQKRPGGLIA
jgi:phage-related minor tail protein